MHNSTQGESSGSIYCNGQWLRGCISWQDGVITAIEGTPIRPDEISPPYLLPGFIDLHVHGGGGRDLMEGGDALTTITDVHARFGTTTLLATTMTAPHEDILEALEGIAEYRRNGGAVDVPGVHLEGPYINPDKLGAQPDFARHASVAELETYHDIAPLKVITLAPERLDDPVVLPWLLNRNVRVQSGHSLATYEEGLEAFNAGIKGFTHLYNAMPPFQHRSPGLVAVALAHAEFAEIIPDFHHVDIGAMRAAFRAIPSVYAVTDGTAACGMPEGTYHLGQQTVYKRGTCVRLADGGLAGSTLTLDLALRNLVQMGHSLGDASQRVSTIPARYLGLEDRGILQQGKRADIAILDRDLNVSETLLMGSSTFEKSPEA